MALWPDVCIVLVYLSFAVGVHSSSLRQAAPARQSIVDAARLAPRELTPSPWLVGFPHPVHCPDYRPVATE